MAAVCVCIRNRIVSAAELKDSISGYKIIPIPTVPKKVCLPCLVPPPRIASWFGAWIAS